MPIRFLREFLWRLKLRFTPARFEVVASPGRIVCATLALDAIRRAEAIPHDFVVAAGQLTHQADFSSNSGLPQMSESELWDAMNSEITVHNGDLRLVIADARPLNRKVECRLTKQQDGTIRVSFADIGEVEDFRAVFGRRGANRPRYTQAKNRKMS